MVIGLLFMIERVSDTVGLETARSGRKLCIQVGLHGLSFCVLDTVTRTILDFEQVVFENACSPALLLKELKAVLAQRKVVEGDFAGVTVVHKNKFFGLVPQVLFREDSLPHYLKFTTKLLANDHIAYDVIAQQAMVNVYVPYANVNNYIFDRFGAFEFIHSGTVLLSALLHQGSLATEAVCYVHVSEREMAVAVLSEKRVLFYNQFDYRTPEDFLYYLLFSLKQLPVALPAVELKLLGAVAEGDALYTACSGYMERVSVVVPHTFFYLGEEIADSNIDFTLLYGL